MSNMDPGEHPFRRRPGNCKNGARAVCNLRQGRACAGRFHPLRTAADGDQYARDHGVMVKMATPCLV